MKTIETDLKVDNAAVGTLATEMKDVATKLGEWANTIAGQKTKALANWSGKTADLFGRYVDATKDGTSGLGTEAKELADAAQTFHDSVAGCRGRMDDLLDKARKGGLLVSGTAILHPGQGPTFMTAPGTPLSADAQAAIAAHKAKLDLYAQLETDVSSEFGTLNQAHTTFQDACRNVRAPAALNVEDRPTGSGGGLTSLTDLYLFWANKWAGKDAFGGAITVLNDGTIVPSDPAAAMALFGNIGQIHQGQIGDCWLISALIAVAQRDPKFIYDHIKNSGDGWDVTLYVDGKPKVVHVGPNDLVAKGTRDANGNPNWVSVYEEAVAQTFNGNYGAMNGGVSEDGLAIVNGKPTAQSLKPDLRTMADAIHNGQPVTTCTPGWASSPLVPMHVYTVESVDLANNKVTVINPWGGQNGQPDRLTMSTQEYYDKFWTTGIGSTK